jgi:MFS family permease
VLLQAFIAYLVTLEMEALGASAADTARILMVYFLAVALVSPVAARFSDHRLQPTYVTLIGAIIAGLALCAPVFWPAQWTMLFAVGGAGLAHGMIRDTQVVIAMEIAEGDLAYLNLNTVMGSLRMLERIGSIVGLICIALFSSFAGYVSAIGAVGVWVLAGAAAFAVAMYLTPSEAHARKHLPR